MNRRDLLVGVVGAGASAVMPSIVQAAVIQAVSGDATLWTAAQQIADGGINASPQYATSLGLDVGPNAALRHRLDDRSPAALARNLARTKAGIASIEAVDPRTLSAPFALYREVYLYRQRGRTIGPEHFGVSTLQSPFVITHQDGAYFTIPDFLDTTHKIRNAEDAEAYLDRVRAFGVALDQDSERQVAEAERGYLAPAFVLDRALAQLAAVRMPAAADNMLTRSIVRRTMGTVSSDWGARCTAIVEGSVYPALDRQIALMRRLRAGARTSAGVWDVPDGEALYAAALEDATTTRSDAVELHRLGLAEVGEIGAQLDGLLAGQGFTRGSVGERLLALSRRPDLIYPDTPAGRAELLRDANTMTNVMRSRLSALFGEPPNIPLQIEQAAVEIEDGASNGNYFPASADGSVPARFRINLKALANSPRYALPAFVYQEGVPGHHLQKCYAQSGMNLRFTAYSEGWALYAEQLADTLGGYATPLDRIGYLQSRLFRAARLVVDTGIHARRWSRERATEYLVAETGYPSVLSQREIDRYCARPGQACSYMVGYLAWVQVFENARRIMGARYNVKKFHDVLRRGEVPLAVLKRLAEEHARVSI